MEIKKELPAYTAPGDFVALDIELFEAEEKRLHRPDTGHFAALSVCSEGDPDTVYVVTNKKDVSKVLERCQDGVWCFHSASFDLTHLRRWADVPPRKKLWDTLIIEKDLWGGYYNKFRLQDLVRRYRSKRIKKGVRATFESTSTLTPEQLKYAATDAYETVRIASEQRKIVQNGRRDAWKIWTQVDMPALWAFLDFRGFRLDVEAWNELASRADDIERELDKEFDINPRSPAQVKEKLNSLGWNVKSTGASILEREISKNANSEASKFAQKILEYRSSQTLVSRYGTNFIEGYLEEEIHNGETIYTIHAEQNVVGALTGRTSVRSPSMQNIPIREHPEYRRPWIARPGNKLIVADWSGQEPRIHAHLCQDEKLIELFRNGIDPYIYTAKHSYGKEITKDDPLRNEAKADFLGATYGQTPWGLAKERNISVDEAKRRHKNFFDLYPRSKEWINTQQEKYDFVETPMGRRVWINPYTYNRKNDVCNYPIQGGAADMMKMSVAEMYFNWDFDCPFGAVGQIHDELILCVPEGIVNEVADYVEEIMVSMGRKVCDSVPFEADVVICDNWLGGKTK